MRVVLLATPERSRLLERLWQLESVEDMAEIVSLTVGLSRAKRIGVDVRRQPTTRSRPWFLRREVAAEICAAESGTIEREAPGLENHSDSDQFDFSARKSDISPRAFHSFGVCCYPSVLGSTVYLPDNLNVPMTTQSRTATRGIATL